MKKIMVLLLISMLLIAACKTQTGNDNNINENNAASDNSDDNGDNEEVEAQEDDDESDGPSKFSSINAIMTAGLPYECTYEVDGATAKVTVKGNKFRSETKVEGKTAYSATNDGEKMYMWFDGESKGFIFDMTQKADVKSYPGAESSPTDVNKNYDIDCRPTIASNSLFEPPSNVNFQDMAQLQKNMMENLGNLQDLPNVDYN